MTFGQIFAMMPDPVEGPEHEGTPSRSLTEVGRDGVQMLRATQVPSSG